MLSEAGCVYTARVKERPTWARVIGANTTVRLTP